MHPADQDHPVTSRLKSLPGPRAPHTLLPRVMAAVREWAERPWYERAWFTWPLYWQVASTALLAAVAAGAVALWPAIQAQISAAVSPFVTAAVNDVAGTAAQAEVVATIGRLIGRTLLTTVVPYAAVVVLIMCVACGAFAMALNYVASGRTLQR